MSLRLVLMRHAKSSWSNAALDDHERPLNKRGLRDAPRIGLALEARGWWPDQVLTSDAVRTLQTWKRMAKGRPKVELTVDPTLYLGGIEAIVASFDAAQPTVQTLLALGHNPGWEQALTWLSGVQRVMTTANAALLTSAAPTWPQALQAPGGFELHTLLRPKDLS